MKYSVTTVCLPELTMKEQTELLARLGYDGVELRVRRVSEEKRKELSEARMVKQVKSLISRRMPDWR